MSAYEYTKNAPFYSRPKKLYDKNNTVTSLERATSLFGTEEKDVVVKLEWCNSTSHKECFVETELVPYPHAPFEYFFMVGNKVSELLFNLYRLTTLHTKSSCAVAFHNYPNTWKIITDETFLENDWSFGSGCITRRIRTTRTNFFSGYGLELAKSYATIIDNVLQELSDLRIDTSKLEKRFDFFSSPDIPNWIKKSVAIGGVMAIKLAVKSIGQDTDIQIPNFDIGNADIDIDIDIDIDCDYSADNDGLNPSLDFDKTSINNNTTPSGIVIPPSADLGDASVYSSTDNNTTPSGIVIPPSVDLGDTSIDTDASLYMSDNGYNVSFGSQKVTLESMGGGLKLPVTITKEPGTAYQFCIESNKGTVHNVPGGNLWVTIGGIKYKLPSKMIG